jgi:hypothetical protein
VVGAIDNVHGDATAAACVTVNVCPATLRVPVRCVPALAAMLYPTTPFPFPVAPDVTVIHVALLAAVHAQPDPAVTAIVPVLAAADAS